MALPQGIFTLTHREFRCAHSVTPSSWSFRAWSGAGWKRSICVAPAFRRSGIGTKLVAFAEERIFADFPNVFMCVSSFNVRAQRLYERLGYEQIARLDDYIVPGHAELLLRKRRTPSP